jgi:hypothetical protein
MGCSNALSKDVACEEMFVWGLDDLNDLRIESMDHPQSIIGQGSAHTDKRKGTKIKKLKKKQRETERQRET